jgi:hypothetical protein
MFSYQFKCQLLLSFHWHFSSFFWLLIAGVHSTQSLDRSSSPSILMSLTITVSLSFANLYLQPYLFTALKTTCLLPSTTSLLLPNRHSSFTPKLNSPPSPCSKYYHWILFSLVNCLFNNLISNLAINLPQTLLLIYSLKKPPQ